jgi:hypothetical protein
MLTHFLFPPHNHDCTYSEFITVSNKQQSKKKGVYTEYIYIHIYETSRLLVCVINIQGLVTFRIILPVYGVLRIQTKKTTNHETPFPLRCFNTKTTTTTTILLIFYQSISSIRSLLFEWDYCKATKSCCVRIVVFIIIFIININIIINNNNNYKATIIYCK